MFASHFVRASKEKPLTPGSSLSQRVLSLLSFPTLGNIYSIEPCRLVPTLATSRFVLLKAVVAARYLASCISLSPSSLPPTRSTILSFTSLRTSHKMNGILMRETATATGSLGYFSCVVLPYCRIGSLYDDDDYVLKSCTSAESLSSSSTTQPSSPEDLVYTTENYPTQRYSLRRLPTNSRQLCSHIRHPNCRQHHCGSNRDRHDPASHCYATCQRRLPPIAPSHS